MKKINLTLLMMAFFALTNSSFAQEGDSAELNKPQLKLSLNYNSNLNYYGRTDSLVSSGFFPLAELWLSPKFYLNAAPIFVNNKVQSFEYAGTVATAGFQHLTDKWLANLYVLKPFYKEDVELVQSALKAQTGLNISRLNKFVNLSIGGDVKFSDNLDYGAMAGLDHIIRIENKNYSVLVFDPGVYVYAGTQQFTTTYNRKKSNTLPILPSENEQVTENVKQFNVLAYEVSIPIIYAKGKFQLLATPSYVIPQNLLTAEGRPDLSEKGANTFYTTVGLKYSF